MVDVPWAPAIRSSGRSSASYWEYGVTFLGNLDKLEVS